MESKPKLTKMIIDEIRELQELNLFDDILEVKNSVKLGNLQSNKEVNKFINN
jgi:hypothetical protein